MCELQRRLEELQEQSRAVEEQLEVEELEGPVLRACDSARLRLTARALDHMIASEHRPLISSSPPAEINRWGTGLRNRYLGFRLFTHTSGGWASFTGVWSHYELVSWSHTHSHLTLMDHSGFKAPCLKKRTWKWGLWAAGSGGFSANHASLENKLIIIVIK